ncbi:MAG: hypothetical protein ACK42C_07365 [Aquificaceae bacterium]|jgi:hypothetical protein|uniref:hypothetical protein n=1 Tax=Hydrogenobacter sp. Uz 6-8 TaxID=3384828 RepID=UPI00309A7C6C
MKLFVLFLLFLASCAPLVCPEGEEVKRAYSEYGAPQSYTAALSLRYGLLRIPVSVQKSEGRFTISGEGKSAEVSLNNLCVGGACVDLPVSPDGIIFGRVLRGDEKMGCSPSGVYFERDEGLFRSRYVFRDGRLSFAEFYDKNRDRKLTLSYLEWSREGYARAIRIHTEGISLTLTVDSLKF